MSDSVTMTVDVAEVLAQLRRLGISVASVLVPAGLAGAEVIRDDARGGAPSPDIEAEVIERGANGVSVDVGPVADRWYYRFAEFGAPSHVMTGAPFLWLDSGGVVRRVVHPGHGARPFLRPAFDGGSDRAADVAGGRINRALSEVAR